MQHAIFPIILPKNNRSFQPTQVVFHPIFLEGTEPILYLFYFQTTNYLLKCLLIYLLCRTDCFVYNDSKFSYTSDPQTRMDYLYSTGKRRGLQNYMLTFPTLKNVPSVHTVIVVGLTVYIH